MTTPNATTPRDAGEQIGAALLKDSLTVKIAPLPHASTFAAIESLTRLANYSKQTLGLTDATLATALHDYNDRNRLGLSQSLIDEICWAFCQRPGKQNSNAGAAIA